MNNSARTNTDVVINAEMPSGDNGVRILLPLDSVQAKRLTRLLWGTDATLFVGPGFSERLMVEGEVKICGDIRGFRARFNDYTYLFAGKCPDVNDFSGAGIVFAPYESTAVEHVHDEVATPSKATEINPPAVSAPPSGAAWVFFMFVPRHKRKTDLALLDEEYDEALQRFGKARADAFYYLQVIRSLWPYASQTFGGWLRKPLQAILDVWMRRFTG